MNPTNPHLAALPALRHALCGLQPMDVIAVEATIGGAQAFRQLRPKGHFCRRHAFGDRQRRPRLEWKPEATGILHHFHAFTPVGGQVLVIEHRHAPAGSFEHPHHFLEELVPGISGLTLLVLRVLTMLTNDHDAIHRQPTGPERQRLSDARINGDAMTGRRPTGQVLFRKLIDVQRNQIHLRLPPTALPGIAQEKPINEVLGMGVLADLRGNQRDFLASQFGFLGSPEGGREGSGGHSKSGRGACGGKELSAGNRGIHGVIGVRVLIRCRYQRGGSARRGRSPAATRPGSMVPKRSAERPKSN